ncbi:unnamed protein product [Cyclocybe aegerita]|uniref:DUF6699 domain-containing protein n=1 Tax=Cyclocybe aegerita TaxID=1973307 RepID=A0A8S0WQC3_CYCAE|nr:unnamed protein product [Cyclocybe aegerita]
MFKWGRSKKSSSYEPKTPKIASIALPDEKYSPIPHYSVYSEKPRRTSSAMQHYVVDSRTTTPRYESSWYQPTHEATYETSRRSRTRTVSTPARHVEAPRPIRPHPSQGPFIPFMGGASDRIRIDSSQALAPVGVPSAQFLEEQIRRERPESMKPHKAPPAKLPLQEDDVESDGTADIDLSEYIPLEHLNKNLPPGVTAVLSKAWLDEQAELKRRQSAPPIKKSSSKASGKSDDARSWKAVPVVDDNVDPSIKPNKMPLKSALKKTSSINPPAPKSILKTRDYDSRACQSDSEFHKPKISNNWAKPLKSFKVPSKAYLEEQQEKVEEQKRNRSSRNSYTPARPTVHEIPPTIFQHTNSGSTSSPTDSSQGHDYHRSRRYSQTERPVPSNYMPAFIKDVKNPPPSIANYQTDPCWALRDWEDRKRQPDPKVIFDLRFDPRHEKFPVRLREGNKGYAPRITQDVLDMFVIPGGLMSSMVLLHRDLPWPIYVQKSGNLNLTVKDVLSAIHDQLSQPLTREEQAQVGRDRIYRCSDYFRRRCQKSPVMTHLLERAGIARVDLLRSNTMFRGLVRHSHYPLNQFELVTEPVPPERS